MASTPLHAVVAHLVIIAAPVAAVLGLLYALRPASRRGLRTPLVIASVLTVVLSICAAIAGDDLAVAFDRHSPGSLKGLTHTHETDGGILTLVAIIFAVIVPILVRWKLAPGRDTSTTGARVWTAVLAVTALILAWTTWTALSSAMASVWSHHIPYTG